MKKILSLCINLLLFIISEAVPPKLIAGGHRVVKKDGATHTISKYYVVPNDFNLNNVTNSTETSQTTLRMNRLYSKSMHTDTASQHQVSEKRAEAVNNQTNQNNAGVNNNEVNRHLDLSDVQADGNTAESTGSVNTEQNLGPVELLKLQVEPIANITNVNSSVTTNEVNVLNSSEALQNGTLLIEDNKRQTFKKNSDINELPSIVRKQLSILKYLKMGEPDGFNIRFSTPTPTLNHVARENDTQEDPKSNQTVPNSADIDEHLDDQALTMKSSLTDDIMPLTIEDKSKNINNQPLTLLTVENITETSKKNVEDKFEDLILTKFIAVQESFVQNLQSFWKLIKLNIDRISDDDELLIKINKLSMLLHIFTSLYEAALSQQPVESMIDSIIDILQIPFVEVKKSNTNESQSQTEVTGDYDEECLRKCGQKRFKPQLDSNGTYLSETESQEVSDNLELKNLELQRRQKSNSDDGDDWANSSNDPGSNQVAVTNELPNILRSQLLDLNKLNVGVPDGFNIRSSTPTPTLNLIARENDVEENPKSNQIIPDSEDIDEHMKMRLTDNIMPWVIEDKSTKNIDNQPLTIEPKLADNIMPWTIEDKSTKNLDDQPLTIESKLADNIMPWHIEDKTTNHQPWIIEHRSTNTLPWTIADRGTKKLPWKVKNRADPNWTIENKMGHSPKTLYQSRYPSAITHGGKILLHPNQPMTGTVHSVKHGVKKPYLIYTYVINPETSSYEIPTLDNFVKVKSREPKANLETRLYGLPTSHGGNKIMYANQSSPSYYESHFSLSKPTVDISSQTNNIQLKDTNHVTSPYGTSNEVNPPDFLPEITQDDNQPKYLVGHEPETNHKAALLQPNRFPSDSQTNSDQENEVLQVPEVGLHPGVLLPNVPSTPFESLINLGNTEPVSPASADAIDINPGIGDTKPNPYNRKIYLNRIQQTNLHPGLISKDSYYSEYTNLPDDYEESSPLYGRETHKHLGLISTASSSSAYTNLPDDYDEPTPAYDRKTHKYPGSISTASSSSAYTNLPDGYDEPSRVNGGKIHKHPGLISTASSSSAYTNLLDEYDGPVYGGQTHQHPILIISSASSSSGYTNLPNEYDEPVHVVQTHQHPGLVSSLASSNSEYINVQNDYDKPSPVYGGQIHEYSGFISKASADSEYTNLPNNYNNPIPDYGHHTDRHPGLITKVSHYPEYKNLVNGYYETIPLYGGQIQKHPAFISKASSHSEYYKSLPNEYNNPTSDNEEATDRYPVHIPVNDRPIKIEDNLLVSSPYEHKGHVVEPSFIAHIHGNQPTGLNYLKHLKLKLAPTYRLFTLDNLLKMHDAVIKTIKANDDKPDVYDNQVLINLRKIINIILILAEHLEEPEGSIEWYEKIFYNTQRENRHPLEIYVYNLIRQRWLHELISVLYNNNFNFNILQNPRIFSFLGSWRFPSYVLNFMEIEKLLQHKFDAPELLDQTFSSQYGPEDKFDTHTYDDVLEKGPENLENYVTNNVIESYKTPNAGIVLSIAGVEAEPDANVIIHILQKYLHYKSFIEKQVNVIIRDNKVEMLKQIILFLREKGYDAVTITDLIRKLYIAVYSIEGKGCQTYHANFVKNMYDVILPVLRRSGR